MVGPVDGCGLQPWSPAAVEGRAQHLARGIPVGCQRIFADVHRGEVERLLAVAFGIGQSQVVDIGIALAVVEPVETGDEAAFDRAELGVLAGDRIPFPLTQFVDVGAAAE